MHVYEHKGRQFIDELLTNWIIKVNGKIFFLNMNICNTHQTVSTQGEGERADVGQSAVDYPDGRGWCGVDPYTGLSTGC